jgi:hypothetical protein
MVCFQWVAAELGDVLSFTGDEAIRSGHSKAQSNHKQTPWYSVGSSQTTEVKARE